MVVTSRPPPPAPPRAPWPPPTGPRRAPCPPSPPPATTGSCWPAAPGEAWGDACSPEECALLEGLRQIRSLTWPLHYIRGWVPTRGNHGGVNISYQKKPLLRRLYKTPRIIPKRFWIPTTTSSITARKWFQASRYS